MSVEGNLFFEVDWKSPAQSAFDVEYDRIWSDKMDKGLFRYTLDRVQSKMIIGERNSYFVQLNVDRALKKRDPHLILDVRQPFDSTSFNFTRINEQEIMMKFEGSTNEPGDVVAINVSPLEEGHSLLLPQLSSQLPQILTISALKFAINIILSSKKPSFRAGFNGMLAYATVNHLHFHAYHLQVKMPLETIRVTRLIGRCHILDEYPSKGFVFEIKNVGDIDAVVSDVVKITEMFLDNQFPHNLYITRGLSFDDPNLSSSVRNCLRIYLWARTPSTYLKELTSFNPALCELFGHFLIKDSESFVKTNETFIETTLESITAPMFEKAVPLVKSLFASS